MAEVTTLTLCDEFQGTNELTGDDIGTALEVEGTFQPYILLMPHMSMSYTMQDPIWETDSLMPKPVTRLSIVEDRVPVQQTMACSQAYLLFPPDTRSRIYKGKALAEDNSGFLGNSFRCIYDGDLRRPLLGCLSIQPTSHDSMLPPSHSTVSSIPRLRSSTLKWKIYSRISSQTAATVLQAMSDDCPFTVTPGALEERFPFHSHAGIEELQHRPQ